MGPTYRQSPMDDEAKKQLNDFKDKYVPLRKRSLRAYRCRCGTLASIAALENLECAYCGAPIPKELPCP